MSENQEIQEIFDDFLESIKSLETNIVATVSDTNTDIEMVLRELLVYLNSTSNFLEEIQKEVDVINKSSEKISDVPVEIRNLAKDINLFIENQTKKIIEILKKVYATNTKTLNSIGVYSKKISLEVDSTGKKIDKQTEMLNNLNNSLEIMNSKIETTEEAIKKNQEDFMKIVNRVFDTNTAKLDVQSQTIKSEFELKKEKILLWGKIAALILGSGGVVYLIFSSIFG